MPPRKTSLALFLFLNTFLIQSFTSPAPSERDYLTVYPQQVKFEFYTNFWHPAIESTEYSQVMEDAPERNEQFYQRAIQYFLEGQYEQSLVTANRLENDYRKNIILAGLSVQYAVSGNYEQANQIAQELDTPYYKVWALGGIAVEYTRDGQEEQALQILAEALLVSDGIENLIEKERAVGEIATVYASSGRLQEALELADWLIENPSNPSEFSEILGKNYYSDYVMLHAKTLCEIAVILSQSEQIQQSQEILKSVQAVADTQPLSSLGVIPKTLQSANEQVDPNERVLSERSAIGITSPIPEPSLSTTVENPQYLFPINLVAQLRSNELSLNIALSQREISLSASRAQMLSLIAVTHIRTGQYDEADKTIQDIAKQAVVANQHILNFIRVNGEINWSDQLPNLPHTLNDDDDFGISQHINELLGQVMLLTAIRENFLFYDSATDFQNNQKDMAEVGLLIRDKREEEAIDSIKQSFSLEILLPKKQLSDSLLASGISIRPRIALPTVIPRPDPLLSSLPVDIQSSLNAGQYIQSIQSVQSTNNAERFDLLGKIAVFLIREGEYELVLSIANDVRQTVSYNPNNEESRWQSLPAFEALQKIAFALFEAREYERSFQVAKHIQLISPFNVYCLETLSDCYSDPLEALLQMYGYSQNFEQALKVVEVITDPIRRARARVQLAKLYYEANQIDLALHEMHQSTLDSQLIGNQNFRVSVILDIAHQYFLMQEINQFHQTMQTALYQAQAISDLISRENAFADIAVTYSAAEQIEKSLEITQLIEATIVRDGALEEIAMHFKTRKQYDQALSVVEMISLDSRQSAPLQNIAYSLILDNKYREALNMLQRIKNTSEAIDLIDMAQIGIAIEYRIAEKFEESKQVAQAITNDEYRNQLFDSIAIGYLTNESDEDALHIAQLIDQPEQKSQTLSKIARFQAYNERYEDALVIAELVSIPEQKAQAFSDIAQFQANHGRYEDAIKVAQSINIEEIRMQAIINIAKSYIREGSNTLGLHHRQLLAVWEKALIDAKLRGDSYQEAIFLLAIGVGKAATWQYQHGIESLQEGLFKLQENSSGSSHSEVDLVNEIALANNNLSRLYRLVGNYSKALEHASENESELALIYNSLGRQDKAFWYQWQALYTSRLFRSFSGSYSDYDNFRESNSLLGLGKIHFGPDFSPARFEGGHLIRSELNSGMRSENDDGRAKFCASSALICSLGRGFCRFAQQQRMAKPGCRSTRLTINPRTESRGNERPQWRPYPG